jgi:hypothetical protein
MQNKPKVKKKPAKKKPAKKKAPAKKGRKKVPDSTRAKHIEKRLREAGLTEKEIKAVKENR